MPHYRIDKTDGSSEYAEGIRVLVDAESTVLEGRRGGAWHPSLTVPSHQVNAVYQRLTEVNGTWRWSRVIPTRALGLHRLAYPTSGE